VKELRGKTAIVTGASRGIGRAVALQLAAAGMRVVLTARSADGLRAVQEQVEARGGEAHIVPGDIRSAALREQLLAETKERFGPPHVLVNNAGIELVLPFDQTPPEEIAGLLETNLVAAILLTRLVVPEMLALGEGHIVNVASMAGKRAPAYNAVYAASKAGLLLFTQGLRAELRPRGVSASAVAPGLVSGDGMYADLIRGRQIKTPLMLGSVPVEKVARAVLKAIREDHPELVVWRGPIRPAAVLFEASPRLAERIVPFFGANRLFGQIAQEELAAREARAAVDGVSPGRA